MPSAPSVSRTTGQMLSDLMLSRVRQTNAGLFDVQKQISTGKKQSTPSDDPSNVSAILFLQEALEARDQHQKNLEN